jgi:prolyl oligopeptidase
MTRWPPAALASALALTALAADLGYPPAKRVDVVDEYHGVQVRDPYRWLEDLDSAETRAWIEAQNRLTTSFFDGIPARVRIRERLTRLWNYERYGLPVARGGRYFYTRNDGLQNQNVLLVAERLDAEPHVLLDPNLLSKDGTVALTSWSPSEDGKRLAYGLAEAGSDWQTWRVRDVATGTDLADEVRWVKFSNASWARDGSGFYYSRFEEPKPGVALKALSQNHKVYFHRIGTPQEADALVYHRPERPAWYLGADVSEDGRYLVIAASEGTDKNGLFYKDLADPSAGVVELLGAFDAHYGYVGNDGPLFWVWTDRGAPRGRLVAIDLHRPAPAEWATLIPEAEEPLDAASVVGDRFIASYLKDARSLVRVFDTKGTALGSVELPAIGTATGFEGKRSDPETFYTFGSYLEPPVVVRYDSQSGRSSVFRRPKVDFDPAAYETKQAFYASKDGVRVPIFVSHRRRIALDGSHPTLLYGYGGFSISQTPSFSPANLAWMELGGVYAVANLRGGSEYGEEWHRAGVKLRKQTVFDDFVAAAEWLIASGYTRRERLAIYGRSNGGLLVGAVLTQRPDLVGAALPAVGVLDMLRFPEFTAGRGWVPEYGSPADPQEFRSLYAYSPYHNLKPGTCYPPTLVTTADHDDRVFPAHSFKFAAQLQAVPACDRPSLIRIETRAGHGAGKPTSKRIEEAADQWAFLLHALGVETAAGAGPAGGSPRGEP